MRRLYYWLWLKLHPQARWFNQQHTLYIKQQEANHDSHTDPSR